MGARTAQQAWGALAVLVALVATALPASAWAADADVCGYAHLRASSDVPGTYTLVIQADDRADAEVGPIYLGPVPTDGFSDEYDVPQVERKRPWYKDDYIGCISRVEITDAIRPASLAYWFAEMDGLRSLDLSGLDTSGAVSMSNLFFGCGALESVDLGSFNTSTVEDMSSMFSACSSLKGVDVGSFDTSKVTTMEGMFDSCRQLSTLNLSGFDTANVTTMARMFLGCNHLSTLDVSGFDLSGLASEGDPVKSMFNWCDSLQLLKLGPGFRSAVDTVVAKLADRQSLGFFFENASGGRARLVADVEGTAAVENVASLLAACEPSGPTAFLITELSAGEGDDLPQVADESVYVYRDGATLLIRSSRDGSGTYLGTARATLGDPDMAGRESFTRVVVEDEIAPFTTTNWFSGFSNLADIEGIDNLDTSRTVHMAKMFADCSSLKQVDLSRMDVSGVASMYGMFAGCTSLSQVNMPASADVGNLRFADDLFAGCSSLAGFDLSFFADAPKLEYLSGMFAGCSGLESVGLPASRMDTPNVTAMGGMFAGCARLGSIDLSKLDTQSAADLSGMFENCASLGAVALAGFDAGAVLDVSRMFAGCANLASLEYGDVDLGGVERTEGAFEGCTKLDTVHVRAASSFAAGLFPDGMWERRGDAGAGYLRAERVPDGSALGEDATYVRVAAHVSSCAALSDEGVLAIAASESELGRPAQFWIDESGYERAQDVPWSDRRADVRSAVVVGDGDVAPASTAFWFSGCGNLTSVDLAGLDASSVGSMRDMFEGCAKLQRVDLADKDLARVDDLSGMFDGCAELSEVGLPAGKAGMKPATVARMFRLCSRLRAVDLSGMDTARAGDYSEMFRGCAGLASLDLTGFDTFNATNMRRMFHGCRGLETVTLGPGFTFRGHGTYRLPGGELPTGFWQPSTDADKAYAADSVPSFGSVSGPVTLTRLADEQAHDPGITIVSIRESAQGEPQLTVESTVTEDGEELLDYTVEEAYGTATLFVGESPRASSAKWVNSRVKASTLRSIKARRDITEVDLGPNVSRVASRVFAGAPHVNTIKVYSSKLSKKARVKNCLAGSNVRWVYVASWLSNRNRVKDAFAQYSGKWVTTGLTFS